MGSCARETTWSAVLLLSAGCGWPSVSAREVVQCTFYAQTSGAPGVLPSSSERTLTVARGERGQVELAPLTLRSVFGAEGFGVWVTHGEREIFRSQYPLETRRHDGSLTGLVHLKDAGSPVNYQLYCRRMVSVDEAPDRANRAAEQRERAQRERIAELDETLHDRSHPLAVRADALKELHERRQRTFRGLALDGAKLDGADLRESHMLDARFVGASLQGAQLYFNQLQRADFTRANLNGANLYSVELADAKLRQASLRRAGLENAELQRASLHGADLTDAYLARAVLTGADLSDANLERANLEGADLRTANFSGANLMGARLKDAKLLGAKLEGARNLSAAQLAAAQGENVAR